MIIHNLLKAVIAYTSPCNAANKLNEFTQRIGINSQLVIHFWFIRVTSVRNNIHNPKVYTHKYHILKGCYREELELDRLYLLLLAGDRDLDFDFDCLRLRSGVRDLLRGGDLHEISKM